MLAAAGAVVQHYAAWRGGADRKGSGQMGAALLFAACGVMELFVWKQDDDKEPGNFGDPAKWSQTGSYSKENRDRELVNGRFAMLLGCSSGRFLCLEPLSIMGIFGAELATGKAAEAVTEVAEAVAEAAERVPPVA
eukprot:Skav213470  [mRNA]  locus=scaffold3211:238385:241468:- [translate_table: standard]